MKLSINSWHFKFVSILYTPSKSLCVYFWQIPLTLISILGMLFFSAMFIGFMLSPFFVWYNPDLWFIGLIACLFWGYIGVDIAGHYENHPILGKHIAFKRKHSKPSLVVEYFKAIKNKVCPIIEWRNE